MPADAWAVPLAVGQYRQPDKTTNSKQRNSGTQDPFVRGHMTGQNSRIDDTLLVREAQRGDRAAFEELVRHYDQAVLRLAMHLTGSESEAQDVYQEAFLKAYRNIGKFRFECSFYTWIYRIVTNLCLDHLRKRQVRKGRCSGCGGWSGRVLRCAGTGAGRAGGGEPEQGLMSQELGQKINRALEQLSHGSEWCLS